VTVFFAMSTAGRYVYDFQTLTNTNEHLGAGGGDAAAAAADASVGDASASVGDASAPRVSLAEANKAKRKRRERYEKVGKAGGRPMGARNAPGRRSTTAKRRRDGAPRSDRGGVAADSTPVAKRMRFSDVAAVATLVEEVRPFY
jgi:hypothetical protein